MTLNYPDILVSAGLETVKYVSDTDVITNKHQQVQGKLFIVILLVFVVTTVYLNIYYYNICFYINKMADQAQPGATMQRFLVFTNLINFVPEEDLSKCLRRAAAAAERKWLELGKRRKKSLLAKGLPRLVYIYR